ncbi:hypothetical protein QR680_006175 [Steinernema hermaphroditum]|uniref:Secreted protein n=1 Tax=Steinernema hermaphroditum TaxID=289476 RepID=A0AA39HUN5_9BILA|nr:hypothetical protein QR680_006175 [Steinernema hermaphroditum]
MVPRLLCILVTMFLATALTSSSYGGDLSNKTHRVFVLDVLNLPQHHQCPIFILKERSFFDQHDLHFA